MPYDPNDPRLTAFALGELDDDPAERAAVEAQVADCAESRRAVDEIRATARLLTEQLRGEPAPGLSPEHREAIEGTLADPPKRPRRRWIPYALAASLLVALVGTLGLRALAPTADPLGLALLGESPADVATPEA